ncbi:MAG: type I glyceraldehyde-3-phosphate dehydrogenase [Candidatus Cloacimonetes bacterium]|nr:type I glyceraldehyde-3-phosphate dehydrogenase [Candidatus Cloacimonadota bacterium]
MKKIAINGFGRIGRLALRVILDKYPDLQVAAINDLTDAPTLAHLFKYDSVHGKFQGSVSAESDFLLIDGKKIRIFAEKDPEMLPWKELEVEYILECTGIFRSREKAGKHLTAGASKVILSVPAKDAIDATIVMGVNEGTLKPDHKIISNASCTTNCLAPVCKVINDKFGILSGMMTTIHSYTNDQKILDLPHKDLRRARAAAMNMIPTSTGAAKAIGLVIPELDGKLSGVAVRVPTPDASLVDLTLILARKATRDEINQAIKDASENNMKGILEYCTEPVVSGDIIGNPHSSVFDADMTDVKEDQVKVFSWYDNEFGYANRLVDLLDYATRI